MWGNEYVPRTLNFSFLYEYLQAVTLLVVVPEGQGRFATCIPCPCQSTGNIRHIGVVEKLTCLRRKVRDVLCLRDLLTEDLPALVADKHPYRNTIYASHSSGNPSMSSFVEDELTITTDVNHDFFKFRRSD